MASLTAVVLFATLLAALFSAGSCLQCFKGRSSGSFNKTEVILSNCTDPKHVCVRIAYTLDGKDVVMRDCMSPQHGSEMLEDVREELKRSSKDQKTLPSLKSLLTCEGNKCNSAKWIEISWILTLVASTTAILAGSR